MNDILKKIADTIKKHNMTAPGSRIVAGVSGGPDSICMLHSLYTLYRLAENPETTAPPAADRIIAVHVNHGIRGDEAYDDQKYVEEFCKTLGVRCVVKSFDVPKEAAAAGESVEETGRRLRYGAFYSTAEEYGAEIVAVAHNKNDQAETVLMRIMRGTGIKGLAGMEYVRTVGKINIIRPLLDISRDEIEHYCRGCGLNPRIDSTNLKEIYTRNRIRLRLMPYIEANFNTNAVDALVRLSEQARRDEEYISERALEYFEASWDENERSLNLSGFSSLHGSVAVRVMMKCMSAMGAEQNVYSHQLDRLTKLALSAAETKEADIADNIYARYNYGKLWFSRRRPAFIKTDSDLNSFYLIFPFDKLERYGVAEIDADEISLNIRKYKNTGNNDFSSGIFMDYDKLKAAASGTELCFRTRRPGDRIHLKGMTGTKKLQDYFVDRKIPKVNRENMLLLAAGGSVLLAGREVSAECRIDADTLCIISIEYSGTLW